MVESRHRWLLGLLRAEQQDAWTEQPPLGWLLISISTAGAPASLRTQVWRRLRSLGALYLQQSVCLLPDRPEVARAVHRLVARVHHDGGSARLLRVVLPQPAEQAAVIAAAHGGQARAAVERCAQALAEFEAAALDSEAPDPSPGPRPHHASPAGRLRLANPRLAPGQADQTKGRPCRRPCSRWSCSWPVSPPWCGAPRPSPST
jgi:hypothetical protein